MRVMDVLYAFPNLLFVIIIMTYLRRSFSWSIAARCCRRTFDRATGGLLASTSVSASVG